MRDLVLDTIAAVAMITVFLLAPLGAGSLLQPDQADVRIGGEP